jgi:hypothetical protein
MVLSQNPKRPLQAMSCEADNLDEAVEIAKVSSPGDTRR